MTEQEIYQKALEKFGTKRQLFKLAEECNELSRAIIRYFDATNNVDKYKTILDALGNLKEELADVNIMFNQARLFVNWKPDKQHKLERLKKMLEEI